MQRALSRGYATAALRVGQGWLAPDEKSRGFQTRGLKLFFFRGTGSTRPHHRDTGRDDEEVRVTAEVTTHVPCLAPHSRLRNTSRGVCVTELQKGFTGTELSRGENFVALEDQEMKDSV